MKKSTSGCGPSRASGGTSGRAEDMATPLSGRGMNGLSQSRRGEPASPIRLLPNPPSPSPSSTGRLTRAHLETGRGAASRRGSSEIHLLPQSFTHPPYFRIASIAAGLRLPMGSSRVCLRVSRHRGPEEGSVWCMSRPTREVGAREFQHQSASCAFFHPWL